MAALMLCDLHTKQKPLSYPELDLSEIKHCIKSYRNTLHWVENRWPEISSDDRNQLLSAVYAYVEHDPQILQISLNEYANQSKGILDQVSHFIFLAKLALYIRASNEAMSLARQIADAVLHRVELENPKYQAVLTEALSESNLTKSPTSSDDIFQEFLAEQDADTAKPL